MKRTATKRALRKLMHEKMAKKAMRTFAASVVHVEFTPAMQSRADELAAFARRAKDAGFLDRYRSAA